MTSHKREGQNGSCDAEVTLTSSLAPPVTSPELQRNERHSLICCSRHFADINNKATDETWYKRAVDYHKIDSDAFVYSIPFDVGEKPTTVTATHSIMVGKGPQKAPVAVVGMQIDYDTFYDVFMNTTSRV